MSAKAHNFTRAMRRDHGLIGGLDLPGDTSDHDKNIRHCRNYFREIQQAGDNPNMEASFDMTSFQCHVSEPFYELGIVMQRHLQQISDIIQTHISSIDTRPLPPFETPYDPPFSENSDAFMSFHGMYYPTLSPNHSTTGEPYFCAGQLPPQTENVSYDTRLAQIGPSGGPTHGQSHTHSAASMYPPENAHQTPYEPINFSQLQDNGSVVDLCGNFLFNHIVDERSRKTTTSEFPVHQPHSNEPIHGESSSVWPETSAETQVDDGVSSTSFICSVQSSSPGLESSNSAVIETPSTSVPR